MRLGTRMGVAAGGAVLAVVSVAAVPAGAAPADYVRAGYGVNACPEGSFCLYKDADYNGRSTHAVLVASQNVQALSNFEFDNKATSYINKTGRVVTLYKDNAHTGAQHTVEARKRLAKLPADWDNTISSVKFRS